MSIGKKSYLLDSVNKYTQLFAALILLFMVTHIVIDVFASSVLGKPLEGTIELVSKYYMVAIVYLPLAYLQATDKHIVAGIFTENAGEPFRRFCKCVTAILMCVFGVLLAWRCGVEARHMTALNEQIQTASYFIPAWPSRWIPVVAGVLIALQSIASLLAVFMGERDKDTESCLDGSTSVNSSARQGRPDMHKAGISAKAFS
ncbi:hypothetical protein PuT2_14590 [Pusillimonas sp. T2]|uniref:TRAP transporter small permease n=1 Tax=Pusillimonas sp. T2 TaxID=1548123 RepID=UPI000B8AE249|nr:TRAP transporter small permease [Pusillimonas sp. T2]OXR48084.1 hypothetical protein PuT2_14590 [Pusillimonas sp. T2]